MPSILRKSLDYIPQTLQYKSPPTVLFTRTKKIGSQIFNYKHTIDNVITNEWKIDNTQVCDCHLSKFKDPHYNHIVTGDLRVIDNNKERTME